MPELADDATHEDIEKYVDEVVQAAEKEEQPEEKGDAKAIAEERDQPTGDMTAEEPSGSDDTAPEGEETGDSEGQDWLDDDLKAEAAAYGISDEEVADFTSREEFERALRLFDRSALEAGRKAMAEGESAEAPKGEPPRDEQGKFTKPESQDGKFEIDLDTEVYDEGLVDRLTKMRDHYEERISALEARFEEVAIEAEEKQFDSFVDSLGHTDLFGKTDKENEKQLQRRQDLLIAVKAQQLGLRQLGREVDLNGALVARVARMVFAEELGKKDVKARTRRLSRQSERRQGSGVTRPSETPENAREYARRLYKELDSA